MQQDEAHILKLTRRGGGGGPLARTDVADPCWDMGEDARLPTLARSIFKTMPTSILARLNRFRRKVGAVWLRIPHRERLPCGSGCFSLRGSMKAYDFIQVSSARRYSSIEWACAMGRSLSLARTCPCERLSSFWQAGSFDGRPRERLEPPACPAQAAVQPRFNLCL